MALGIFRKIKEFWGKLRSKWTRSPLKPAMQKIWTITKPIIPSIVQAVPGGEKVAPIVQKVIPTAEKVMGLTTTNTQAPANNMIGLANPLTPGMSLKELVSGGSDYTRLRKI